jgi:hypothetical protein
MQGTELGHWQLAVWAQPEMVELIDEIDQHSKLGVISSTTSSHSNKSYIPSTGTCGITGKLV